MRKAVIFLFIALFAAYGGAQNAPVGFDLSNYGVRVEPDRRVMVVLATLEAAQSLDPKDNGGRLMATPLSDKSVAFREELARDNAALPDDLRKKISVFVSSYKKRKGLSDADLLTPFISMAYTLSPVPDLNDPVVTSDLPGELLDVLDFAPLVREFYRRSTISTRLEDYVKEYRTAADTTLRPSARDMVSELLDYLHTRPKLTFTERVKTSVKKPGTKSTTIERTEIVTHDRHFTIVPEKLAARGNINFLNIRDDYYVIVPPETDLTTSEARRAFLRFVMDPLVLEHSKDVEPMREWGRQSLDEVRKADAKISPDILLAISRSLVAAIDIRQRQYVAERVATNQARQRITALKTDDERRAVSSELERYKQSLADEAAQELYEDYQRGAVFGFYFANELRGVEDSGFDISGSMTEMLASFDSAKENDRISSTADARKRALAARAERKKNPQETAAVVANPVTTRLFDIQKTIDAKDYRKAETDLKQLLVEFPGEPRIYFNIGRVASLAAVGVTDTEQQKIKLLEAKTAYSNVINSSGADTDPALLSLTYLALGRIYEFGDEPETAIKIYDKVLSYGDIRGGGFAEALAAKQRLLKSRQ
jgi:tetratricopeptide (TPR) repeat protein